MACVGWRHAGKGPVGLRALTSDNPGAAPVAGAVARSAPLHLPASHDLRSRGVTDSAPGCTGLHGTGEAPRLPPVRS